MRFFSTLLVGTAAFVSYAAAQSQVLGFTRVPTSVRAGQGTTIEYTAQDLSEEVTITLRRGDPDNLDTVATLTSSATGGNYTWIPADYFANGDDYALQIQQGREINYSGAFTISGANAAAVSSAQAVTASLSSVGAAITSSYAQSASVASIQSIIASYNASLANLTGAHTPTPLTGAASSAGTGTALPRNTTMVSPTLTSTASSTSASGSSGSGSSQGSSTGSAPAASSSGAAAQTVSAISGASPLALVLCLFAGMFL